MQSVEISGLKEVQKRLEGYPEAMKKARSEFFEEAGREMLSTVRRRIGGQGYVANVQEVYTPCTGTNDYRTFCKFMDKYQNFFILDGRIVLSDNLLNDRLCFSQVRFISNIYFQIQLSLRLSRCIRQTVVGQHSIWNHNRFIINGR